jgi:hypothetical protein
MDPILPWRISGIIEAVFKKNGSYNRGCSPRSYQVHSHIHLGNTRCEKTIITIEKNYSYYLKITLKKEFRKFKIKKFIYLFSFENNSFLVCRPPIEDGETDAEVYNLMERCWAQVLYCTYNTKMLINNHTMRKKIVR